MLVELDALGRRFICHVGNIAIKSTETELIEVGDVVGYGSKGDEYC